MSVNSSLLGLFVVDADDGEDDADVADAGPVVDAELMLKH